MARGGDGRYRDEMVCLTDVTVGGSGSVTASTRFSLFRRPLQLMILDLERPADQQVASVRSPLMPHTLFRRDFETCLVAASPSV